MHVARGVLRNLFAAVALVTLALPLAVNGQTATPASAQTAVAAHSYNTTGGTCGHAATATTPAVTPALDLNCYVSADPGLAFNTIGTTHTVTFTCGAAVGPAGPTGAVPPYPYNAGAPVATDLGGGSANAAPGAAGVIPGCYNVTASVTDETTGSASTFTYARCGSNAASIATASVNCASYASPLCPVGSETVPGGGGVYCGAPDTNYPRGSQMAVSINPGAPHAYLVTFTGYTPLLSTCTAPPATAPAGTPEATLNGAFGNRGTCYTAPAGGFVGSTAGGPTGTPSTGTTGPACPVGFTYVPGPFQVSTNLFVPPFEAPLTAPDGVCSFTVTAEKKYVEITNLTLVGTGPCAAGAGSSTLLYTEGLKTYYGAPCLVTAIATGVTVLKSGVNCANEPGAPGTAKVIAPDFPAGSYYQCVEGSLSVVIPNIGNGANGTNLLNSGPVPVQITGAGASTSNGLPTPSLGTLCAGTPGLTGAFTVTGVPVYVCPTGPGTGSVRACVTGSQLDTQPGICSNTLTFQYILPNQNRVVPYVRWSGEKQVLTKCFGGAGLFGGALVEFTLEGAGANAQATLIPTSAGGTLGSTGGGEIVSASQNTVVTVTDPNGCASVIVYATGEGAVNVDAAIYSTAATAAGTAPLLNEHAFEIYYLKFDHIDLENLKPLTGTGANSVSASTLTSAGGLSVTTLGFSATAASFNFPSAPGANQPAAGGFYSIPLCQFDYVRAMVHGYFELPGDPSGRPASNVTIPGAPNGAAGSYVLPAGRWVLPEDWPVLATFAGFTAGAPNDTTPSSVYAWDLNSGWVFNPGGERPVICAGPAVAPAVNSFPGAVGTTASGAIDNSVNGTGVSYGACFGTDKAGTNYDTAPGVVGDPNCESGVTVGIGPFDITQTCTNPLGLTYKPTGGSVLSGNGTGPNGTGTGFTGFTLGSLSSNSTYLPNGTLNQWDAPMPAAQVSFGITGGPGFLNQVNKTGFYSIPTYNAATGNVNGAVYPDPFYATAIPASPLIPPVTNNGGYLWDTFGFRGGAVIGPTSGAGSIAGLTPTSLASVDPCDELAATALSGHGTATGSGFTAVTTAGGTTTCFVGTGGVIDTTVTQTECTLLHGTFSVVTPATTTAPAVGSCEIGNPPATSVPGGTNITNFGPACPAIAGATTIPQLGGPNVEVANGTGFVAGQTVTVYDRLTGAVIATGLTLTGVAPGPDSSNATLAIPNATTLTFSAASVPASLCLHIEQGVFVSDTVAVTVPASNAGFATLTPGSSVTLTTPSGRSATTTVQSTNPSTGTIYLAGASALATALGGCVITDPTCSAATFLPAGTLIQGGPAVGTAPIRDATPLFPTGIPGGPNTTSTAGQGPYPFWQWVPNPASGATPQSATVYSDNHGEAVISLETGIATTSAPPCVAPYVATPGGAVCLLNTAALGVAGNVPGGVAFQNVLAARAFTAANPGCIQTNPNGTTTAVASTAPVVGATGPAAGQICVNNLGGIEYGAGATLGTTTVQAIADYPYTRGLHAAISSGVITKVFTSAFNKSVTVTPPGTGTAGPAGTSSYTVTITGTDICNNPIVGEPVNVFAIGNAGAVVLAPLGNGTSNGPNAATVILGAGGTASLTLEVLNSALGNNGLVIKAVFPLEQVERFVVVRQGQTAPQTTTVIYTPGYNMVGGPPGSNFGAAEALFTYDPISNTYGNATSSAGSVTSGPPSCTGYFAYFASATSVSLPVPSSPSPATCTLAAGWNLVGNPFATPANLPSGTTAYHFNGTTYDQVSQIPVGGAVFVYQPAAGTLTLTP